MTYVALALANMGNYRVKRTQVVAAQGESDGISGVLLLCLGLRETGLKNINNAAGTDRGCFQISDLYHPEFLRSVPGCPAGQWHTEPGKTALDKGYAPRFEDGLQEAIRILHEGQAFARDHGVQPYDVTRFAVASYNAGVGGALKGYREGDVDQYTTGHDYSAWVLARRAEVQHWLNQHPNWKP